MIAIVISTAVVASPGGGSARLTAIPADSVGAINPARGGITAVVPDEFSPSDVAAGAGSVWVANYNANSVSRIDPVTHTVEQTILGQILDIQALIAARCVTVAVWVTNRFGGTVFEDRPGR